MMPRTTKTLFDAVAKDYDEVLPFFSSFARQFMDWFKPAAGQSVLDSGAGAGALSRLAADHGCKVTATDIAPGMVERLGHLHTEITALEMDAEQLKFPDQAFDCVMAGFSIHLVPTPLNAAKEIFRVLKPGGRFGFSIPWGSEDDPTLEFFNSLREEFLPYADAEQLVDWKPLDAEKVLTDSGFQSIHSIRADVHLSFDTTETFWRWYLSHGSRNLFDALPLPKQKEFRDRVWQMIEVLPEKSLVRGAYFWQGQKQI